MNKIIIDAINTKHTLRVEYHSYFRIVEPHTYGLNKAGHEVVSCWQTSGGSESNEKQGWKILLVREIRAISMTDTLFQNARIGYKRDTETFSRIYAQLEAGIRNHNHL